MWKDDNDKINEVLFKLNEAKFPAKCPICGENDYHMYMVRFSENDKHGSSWVWCSNCKNYSHYQYLIPENWKNMQSIDLDLLEEEPSYLETQKNEIDEYINEFLAQKCTI
jgi:hypothetical protein